MPSRFCCQPEESCDVTSMILPLTFNVTSCSSATRVIALVAALRLVLKYKAPARPVSDAVAILPSLPYLRGPRSDGGEIDRHRGAIGIVKAQTQRLALPSNMDVAPCGSANRLVH